MTAKFERQPPASSRSESFNDAASIIHDPQVRPAVPGGRPIAVGSPPADADSAASGNPWKSTHATAGEVAP